MTIKIIQLHALDNRIDALDESVSTSNQHLVDAICQVHDGKDPTTSLARVVSSLGRLVDEAIRAHDKAQALVLASRKDASRNPKKSSQQRAARKSGKSKKPRRK